MDLSDLNSYLQLLHDLISGTVRRHTFTPLELDLLLDVQALQMRKNAKKEALRRYLHAVQQQFVADGGIPLRFARFSEYETQNTRVEQPARNLMGARNAPA